MKYALIIISLLFTTSLLASSNEERFFENLKHYCGKTLHGKSTFPTDPSDSFHGKLLVMKVSKCTDKEIHIPFIVGEDKSRTWILSLVKQELLFKHDHRHEDGTPHELTMYGGYSNGKGSAVSQSFPADAETKIMVPKGVTNVWTLTIDTENNRFIYNLERHAKPRFSAVLELFQDK